MKKTQKWSILAAALSCSIAMSVIGLTMIRSNADTPANVETTITSKTHGETMTLLSGETAEFALNYTIGSAINYVNGTGKVEDRGIPKPATISWENTRDDALYYTLRIGLECDLSDATSYLMTETTAEIDYLFAAKHYYYQIYAHYDNDEVVKSRVFDFFTTDVPRTVAVEGVTNTRDLGGRFVLGGQYQIKQGMVYRGAEVNRSLGAITEEGKRVMVYDLGIKTDLDLRGGDVQNPTSTSPIDDSLNYIHVEAPWYSHIYNSKYKEALATEFRTFANPDNYPIYLHCSVGRDRAGTLSGLLAALVGVEEIDLFRDYEMSFFSRVGLVDASQAAGQHADLVKNFTLTLNYIKDTYPADTLMDSVERFVVEYLGITKAEVNSIRNILWEEASYSLTDETETSRVSTSRVNLPKKAATTVAETRDFLCTYSKISKDEVEVNYGSSAVNTYTATEAAAKGIPAGYENEVIEVVPIGSNSSCGVLLDFSAEKIPLGMIESLQFRVYIGISDKNANTNYPQIRIAEPNGSGTWVYQKNVATPAGQWTTVTIPYKDNFSALCKDGMLHRFELSMRSQGKVAFYVDSVSYVLKANDGVAPVINYTGDDTVTVALGKGLTFSATATDAQQGEVPVEYVWGEGVALNDNGTPTQTGTYTLTLKATDYHGNVGTKVLTINVLESDTVAPVIAFGISEVKAQVGAKPMFTATATDNNGTCFVETVWSENALDKSGRLTAGVHTWTIEAKDVHGNVTTKTVTFTVTETDPAYTTVTDEKALIGDRTVTFDGKNSITVPYGVSIERPIDPVREEDAAARYRFIGWFVGDQEWDFTNKVTSDVALQSQWKEIKKVYVVTFDGQAATRKVEYGNVIPEQLIPETPKKASTSRIEYVFAGWYLGDKLWNFETDVVTAETNLTSKFTERERLYTVTFDGENAQQCAYGAKVTKPADPQKEATATVRYEFIGWYVGNTLWDFETGVVKYNLSLQSKWNEIAIENPDVDSSTPDIDSTEPDGDSTQVDSSTEPDNDSTQTDSSTQQGGGTNQPGAGGNLLAGCSGVIGGVSGCMLAIGVAAVMLLKKRED